MTAASKALRDDNARRAAISVHHRSILVEAGEVVVFTNSDPHIMSSTPDIRADPPTADVLEIAAASGSQFALLPADNATGNFTKVVQRVPVKIALDDSPLTARLRSGLSAIVTVRTKR